MNSILISVPDGWKRFDAPGEITVEGPLADTGDQRNGFMRIVLKTEEVKPGSRWYNAGHFTGTGIAWRGGSMHVKREVKETRWVAGTNGQSGKYVETDKWRKAGFGGLRLASTLLWTLAHCGGRW